MKDFYDSFCVNKLCVSIKKHPATELLSSLVKGPSRITKRRNTTAVDEKVNSEQIRDQNIPPNETVQKHEPVRSARIVHRRNTDGVDPAIFCDPTFQDLLARTGQFVPDTTQPLDLRVNKEPSDNSNEEQVRDVENGYVIRKNASGAYESALTLQSKAPECSATAQTSTSHTCPKQNIRPVPNLNPIRIGNRSIVPEDSQRSPINFFLEPIRYADDVSKRIARLGASLSDLTNFQKK